MSKPDVTPPQAKPATTTEEQLAAFDWVAGVYEGEELSREQIGNELADFRFMLEQVPKVYMHVTGGRMSKPNYHAETVNVVHDDYVGELVAEELRALSWRPIAEHDGSDDPVDLWRDGERLTDFRWVNGSWRREVGYPVVTQRLTSPPTHFMPVPDGPAA